MINQLSKLKIRYFRTTPQQADGALARKFCAQSSANHEFLRTKKLHPFRVDKETPKQAIGEFFSINNPSIKKYSNTATPPVEVATEGSSAQSLDFEFTNLTFEGVVLRFT